MEEVLKRHGWELAAPSCLALDAEERCDRGAVECKRESTEWSSMFDVLEKEGSNSNARKGWPSAMHNPVCVTEKPRCV